MKPAVKTRPIHRGGPIQSIQPIHKTIGINKLGTLLSSQTTDTPGTTTTTTSHGSLRSNFSNLPDPPPQRKSMFQDFHRREGSSPPLLRSSKALPDLVFVWGFWPPAVTSSSLSPPRRLRKQYTPTPHPANPLRKGSQGPGFRAKSRMSALQQPSRRRTSFLCAAPLL